MSIEKTYLKDLRSTVSEPHIKKYIDFLYSANTNLIAFKVPVSNYTTTRPTRVSYDPSENSLKIDCSKMELLLTRNNTCDSILWRDWVNTPQSLVGTEEFFYLGVRWGATNVLKLTKDFDYVKPVGCMDNNISRTDCHGDRVTNLLVIEKDGDKFLLVGSDHNKSTVIVYRIDQNGDLVYTSTLGNPIGAPESPADDKIQGPFDMAFDPNTNTLFVANNGGRDWACCKRGYISTWDLTDISNPTPKGMVFTYWDNPRVTFPIGVAYDSINNYLYATFDGGHVIKFRYDSSANELYSIDRVSGENRINIDSPRSPLLFESYLITPDYDQYDVKIFDRENLGLLAYYPSMRAFDPCAKYSFTRPVNIYYENGYFYLLSQDKIHKISSAAITDRMEIEFTANLGGNVLVKDVLIDISLDKDFYKTYVSLDGTNYMPIESIKSKEYVTSRLYIKIKPYAIHPELRAINPYSEAIIRSIYIIGEFPK